MSTIKHTPGPWRAFGIMVKDTTDTLGGMSRIVMPEGQFAFCTSQEDARLIAAAPELLEALRFLLSKVDDLSGYWKEDTDHAVRDANEAIAKAEGKL